MIFIRQHFLHSYDRHGDWVMKLRHDYSDFHRTLADVVSMSQKHLGDWFVEKIHNRSISSVQELLEFLNKEMSALLQESNMNAWEAMSAFEHITFRFSVFVRHHSEFTNAFVFGGDDNKIVHALIIKSDFVETLNSNNLISAEIYNDRHLVLFDEKDDNYLLASFIAEKELTVRLAGIDDCHPLFFSMQGQKPRIDGTFIVLDNPSVN